MDEYTAPQGVVDPEVRAYVYSLVSALGGTGSEEDGRYVLGDDALACLKDIKRWLKLYDEKLNRLDVARCLAEANLVKGDLLEILATWPEDEKQDKIRDKIALACLELLVPLTWPLEKGELQITANHYQHAPYLQLAQIGYKREILEHWSSTILRTIIRIGLPSIAFPISERSQRDEGIIKLLLYFLRNIVMISAPSDLPVEWNENEVSRSATIDAFQTQDVFALLLTIASNIGEDFDTQDVVVLEILFHLFKGVNVEKLFMDDVQLDKKNSKDLQSLMAKEAAMLRAYSKNAPTRHNRFGTMIWVKRGEEKMSTVSGQDVLLDGQHALSKMDQSKKWNKPKRGVKEQRTNNHFDVTTPLSKTAKPQLRIFVEDFLDSGFNPLFNHLRRAIEREAERVLELHTQQFLYLIGWFLEAERMRKAKQKKARKEQAQATAFAVDFEADSYALIASVLNQETFILLNRYMQERLDTKHWREVNAGMRCFTQILLTVQEMSESKIDEDQEIAENIQNRIFYEETTHDRVVTILRGYKDQGFNYLDACTELSYVFLRILERYSKENIDLQIRSKRRAKKQKKDAADPQNDSLEPEQDSEAEDEISAQRISRERKFDFKRFAAKFVTQPCVDTFVAFTTYYKDLTTEQLKRAHRFFYRIAFKQEMGVILFRMDIISLFHRMIKGPDGLNTAKAMFAEWQEFVKQVFRRLVKKMKERPELAIELLFSKVNSTVFYLENGYEKQAYSSSPNVPAELKVRGIGGRDAQIGVVISAIFRTNMDEIMFIEEATKSAASERQSWEAEAAARALQNSNEQEGTREGEHEESQKNDAPAVSAKPEPPPITLKPPTEPLRLSLHKNARVRLLLTLIGLTHTDDTDAATTTWMFPPSLSAASLSSASAALESHRQSPTSGYGDDGSIPPEALIKRKRTSARDRAGNDGSYDNDNPREGAERGGGGGMFGPPSSDSELDALDAQAEAHALLFPAGGPTARKPAAAQALEKLGKRRRLQRRRRSAASDADEDDGADGMGGEDEARAKERRKARLKIKSTEFVHSSDEEADAERDRVFFEGEEERRMAQAARVIQELVKGRTVEGKGGDRGEGKEEEEKKKRRRRKSADGAGSGVEAQAEGGRKRRRTSGSAGKSQSDDDGDNGDDAILTSGALFSSSPAPRLGPGAGTSDGEGAEEETPLSSQTEGDLDALQKKERARSGPFADDEDEDEGWEEGELAPASRMRGERTKGSASGDRMDVDGGSDAEDEEVGMVSSRRDREHQRRRMAVPDDSDDE